VARASSSFLNLFVDDAISNYTLNITGTYNMELYISRTLRIIPDFLAGALCIVYIVLMISEIKFSKMINSLLIIINLAVMGLIIFLGIYYADMANWDAQNDTYFSYRLSRMVNGKLFHMKCEAKKMRWLNLN
jgi:amino acid transporter